MARNVVTVSICMPKDLVEKVKEAAEKEDRTVSNYVTLVLKRLLED
jgi:predicted DNA-binding protein